MNFSGRQFVRFQEWNSEKSMTDDDQYGTRSSSYLPTAWKSVGRRLGKFSGRFTTLKPSSNGTLRKNRNQGLSTRKDKILNPQGSFLQNWNKSFLLACVIALAVDPLFFYIPVVDGRKFCLTLDKKLQLIACVLRTFIDAFYLVRIAFQFRTGYIAPSPRVFGSGELVDDLNAIAIRYLSSYFLVDVLAILPLPQIVVLAIIPHRARSVSLATKDLLKFVIFSQYVPRIIRIYPLFEQVKRTAGILTETAWAGAALNLFLFTLASHATGAFWYLFSIEREDSCWRKACRRNEECDFSHLYCQERNQRINDFLSRSCAFIDPEEISNSTVFNFGIFTDALKSGVVESSDFPKKFFYCFWWGLRNLSSLGQDLKTTDFVGENIFAIFISVAGLVLFALLIGNMQKYLQSTSVRIEEMRVKRQDAEEWMSHRMLPQNLRQRIRRYEQYKWQETRGVEEELLLRSLPKDLRMDIKRHLCLNLVMKVPWFKNMDERLLDALCDRLKPMLYTENSYILREGDPINEMLLIMRGNLKSTTTNGGQTGFLEMVDLKAGDFVGDLLTWALDPHSSSHLPISTRTVLALTEVEGFALMADDLKFISSQYRRLHNKQLRHTFRYHSVQWQTWAACFIQAAWRKHCRRKLEKSLKEQEMKMQNTARDESPSRTNLGAAIYASRFASNALRNLRQNERAYGRAHQRLQFLPRKPDDPDFAAADS